MLEIYVLEQLVAFEKYGTLSAAAKELHTSQPALTRSMKKAEAQLGVPLFNRSKNHMELNETGKVAAEYARQVLKKNRELEERVLAFDRGLHTISIGYCAPIPQLVLTPILNNFFPGMTISSDMKEDSDFCQKLENRSYQLAVFHSEPDSERFYSKKCGSEDLFISVLPSSPLASCPEIHLSDLNGMSLLFLSQIGFWTEIGKEKMPDTHFLTQYDEAVYWEVIQESSFPVFLSSYYIRRNQKLNGRIYIPIVDSECHVTYYLACLKTEQSRFQKLFDYIKETTIF